MVSEALHELGGVEYLKQQAVENPPAFMALLGRMVPKDVTLREEPAVIQVITGIPAGDPPTARTTPAVLSSSSQQID